MPDSGHYLYTQRDDWDGWAAGLPTRPIRESMGRESVFPDPYEDGGLPPGWRIESRYALFGRDDHDAVLVQCPDGLWLRVIHRRVMGLSSLTAQYATLVDMYTVAMQRMARGASPDRLDDLFPEVVTAWTRKVLMRSYDPNIPTEAAEQMVLALGGPVRLNPSVFS